LLGAPAGFVGASIPLSPTEVGIEAANAATIGKISDAGIAAYSWARRMAAPSL
jgi:hypothetical protein